MIDIGANLTSSEFAGDLEEVLVRARAEGVEHIIVTGTCNRSSRASAALARLHPDILSATAGIHPHHADRATEDDMEEVRRLIRDEHVVAVGETGLDHFRDFASRENQERVFRAQVEIALGAGMPLFIHDRDSGGEVLRVLKEDPPEYAVIHCFTGSRDDLQAFVELDLYIGITGWICDERRGLGLREIAGLIPTDRLLIETDSPYLVPRTIRPRPRSRRNEPALLAHVAEELARARGESVEELRRSTTENARRLFRLGRA